MLHQRWSSSWGASSSNSLYPDGSNLEKFIPDTNGKNYESESSSNSWPKELVIFLSKHIIGSVQYTVIVVFQTDQINEIAPKKVNLCFFVQKIPIQSISNFQLNFKESQSPDGIKRSDWLSIDLLFHSMVDDHRLMPLIWSSKAAIVMNILISNWFHLH